MKAKSRDINPFNYHCTKEKINVLGKNPHKQQKSRPGQARQDAIELRKNTLLKEYKDRNKSKQGYFKDRRIGENNPTIDAEKKMILRYVASKKKEAKRSMFKLNDDEVLTHKGETLNNDNMQDMADFSDEEQSDDADGNIDGDVVDSQHFGGGLFSRSTDDDLKPKTKKEWMDKIIIDSKKKKLAVKEEKTMQEEAVTEINEAYASLLKTNAAPIMTIEEKQEHKKTCDYSSYDRFFRELTQDNATRAYPSERLKTQDEVEAELKEKMDLYEKERKNRMKNAFEQDEEKATLQLAVRSADALEECFRVDAPIEEESEESLEKNSFRTKIPVESEENEMNKKKTEKSKTGKKKFPKTFKVPDKFEDFWEYLKGYTPADVSVIITKTVKHNHPTTGRSYEKCCQIFAYYLQVLDKLCQPGAESLNEETSPMEYCEGIIAGMFQLVHLSPATSANTLKDILMRKFMLFSKTGYMKYPYTDTFIALRVASMLFPVSDFEHDVLTPAYVLLCKLLAHAKVKTKRDMVAMLFTANLLFEYCKPSKRFSPEIISSLKAFLYLAIPKSDEKSMLSVHTSISRVGPNSQLLTLSKSVKKFDSTVRLKFSSINEEVNKISNKSKLSLIAEALILLTNVIQTYSHLSDAKIIFESVKEFVHLLPTEKYPSYHRQLKAKVITAIQKLAGPGLHIVMDRARAQAITFYEPKIEEVRDYKWKIDNPESEQKRLKLVHKRERKATKREIKKDFQFLSNVRLQETISRDTERKRKLNTIMRELGSQESEYQKYKKMKD